MRPLRTKRPKCAMLMWFFLLWSGASTHAVSVTSATLPRGDQQGYLRPDPKKIEKIGANLYRVGAVTVDAAARQIRFPGWVNLNNGLIEVVICTGYGKRHESVLWSKVRPMDLHLALLLLGLHPGINPAWRPPEDPKARAEMLQVPPGSLVDVSICWSAAGREKSLRAEHALLDLRTSQSLPRTPWVFVGSYVNNGGAYEADQTGSLMTNYHDVYSVLDLPLEAGRSDDYTVANRRVLPERGTPVEIRIRALSDESHGAEKKNAK